MQAEVFCDGEVWALGEFLMDDADSCVEGGLEVARSELLAQDSDDAGVLLVES